MSRSPPLSGEPAGFGKAAKRASNWAANLFATGLILVAALALGRQVLSWWRVDRLGAANSTSGSNSSSAGDPTRSQLLEMGEIPYALRRDSLVGDAAEVLSVLRSRGAEALERGVEFTAEPGTAERRMLSRLHLVQPTASKPGRWELYEQQGPILLVAGVQLGPPLSTTDSPIPSRRVAYWGVAVPMQGDYPKDARPYTLFSCVAGQSSRDTFGKPVPLPTGARSMLSLAGEDGSRLISFRGIGSAAEWRRHFEQGLTSDGWVLKGGWRETTQDWHGRFEKSGGSVDVQWNAEGNELVGLLTATAQK